MSAFDRFLTVRSVAEECIKDDELLELLAKKAAPICYDGFEPSGRMHIAQGVLKVINVRKLTSAGCKVKIWIADWFAHLNLKMGGDLKNIQTAGRYFIEIWKAFGMDEEGVEFLWASEEINSKISKYLLLVFDIARRNNLLRLKRCCQIMGRSEEDELMGSQIIYPCMQCADVFFLQADICQMGLDQRKVNMLAREYCDDIKRKCKPIILSHHMLPGLQQGQEKMSKSDPSSSVFMDDDEEEVNRKILKAYCPPKIVKGNPCMEYIRDLILPFDQFKVEHSTSIGGAKTYKNFEELVADYEDEKLHPADLKPALSKALNKILQPVRDHFNKDVNAKDLLKCVKELQRRSYCAMEETDQLSVSGNIKSLPINSRNDRASLSSTPQLSVKDRFQRVSSVGEEYNHEGELLKLLTTKREPVCYDGFEPSGRMHIAEGVMKVINVRKLISAGCKVKIWIADWFAYLNNKMGGDLKKIETIGRYFIEIWKALSMDQEGVEFLWSSKEIISRADEYLFIVMEISRRTKLSKLMGCSKIMGRSEEELTGGHILYACMQCADIFFLEADICQMGSDQQEVNELAREYCEATERESKPVILSHHMLPGLQQGQVKMSKSDPSSSIYMDDDEAEVNRKIKRAYCPSKIVEGNPCMEYVKYIILPWFNEFKVDRSTKNGGDKTYKSFEEVVADYEDEKLHPADLKPALSKALNKIIQRVRDHFNKNAELKDLLKRVKEIAK